MSTDRNERLPPERILRRVGVDATAPPEEVAAVETVFARAGFRVHARPEIPLSGGPPIPVDWIVYVVVGAPIGAFFTTFAAEAGKDAYLALKEFAAELCAARRATGASGQLKVVHEDMTRMFEMPLPIPDAGIDALREIDWSAETATSSLIWDAKRGYLAWDDVSREWRPVAKREDSSSCGVKKLDSAGRRF